MSDFAKAQLLKYGWTEGKGLGKNENGIVEALRPKLKFDTGGMGHKNIDSNNWWEAAFNKAAGNIKVDSGDQEVSISLLKENTDSYKDKSKKKKLKHSLTYGNFLKTSTLRDGNVTQEKGHENVDVDSSDNELQLPLLTDEELFQACGGRTAHKGARHGLTLNGKLERIAQQEKAMLGQADVSDAFAPISSKVRKQSRAKLRANNSETEEDESNTDSNANDIFGCSTPSGLTRKLAKSTRKKQKRRVNDLTHKLNVLCTMDGNESETNNNAADDNVSDKRSQLKRKKKKGKKEKNLNVDVSDIPVPPEREVDKEVSGSEKAVDDTSVNKRKKKKNKRKNNQCSQDANSYSDQVDQGESTPKKSKTCEYLEDSVVEDENVKRISDDQELEANEYESRHTDEAHRLNFRLKKKKTAKLRKKQKLKLQKITDGLESVHFDAEETSNKDKYSKKKVETIAENLMGVNISENVSEKLKQSTKKGKRNKNEKEGS